MRRFISVVLIPFACLVLGFGYRAGAQPYVAFDNLGPNGTFDQQSGYWFGYRPGFPNLDWAIPAMSFEVGVEGTLSSVTAAMWQITLLDRFTFSLRADDGNKPGTTVLWQNTFDNMLPQPAALVTFPVLNGPYLRFGERYWLLAIGPDMFNNHVWQNGLSGTHTMAYMSSVTNGEWWTFGGHGVSLRVEVIPEPSSCLTLAALLAPAIVRRARPHRTLRTAG
jgi:hypothetical protein